MEQIKQILKIKKIYLRDFIAIIVIFFPIVICRTGIITVEFV